MNAFFVPQLGSMIYTMNGMTTQLNLRADKPGEFMVACRSHYSGDGFSDMHFQMRAVPSPTSSKPGWHAHAQGRAGRWMTPATPTWPSRA